MKKSPYPLEQELGMCWYSTDTQGTGGRLRVRAEDFLVEEIPNEIGTGGPYLICQLIKKDWDLQRAVKEIAKQLGISHRRIGFSGTKDKSALTTQYISLYNVDPEAVEGIRLKDVGLIVAGRAREGLSLGNLRGNRFGIVIRDTTGTSLEEQVSTVAAAAGTGFPNYFGLQRFGVVRPVTHQVGKEILKGDYERAVATYVGIAYPAEAPEVRDARRSFLESRDPLPALHALPVRMGYERAMLHHLQAHHGDYPGALRVLPPKLLSMFVSAFQSYVFNCALSSRMEEGNGLDEPAPGDRLIFSGGRKDRVTEGNLSTARRHLRRGRCRIAIMMPGASPVQRAGLTDRVTQQILEEHGINADSFARAQEFVRTKFEGALRPVAFTTEIGYQIEGKDVRLSFTLLPGQYATTVCREFMKAPPNAMI
jgi:tRNA pseudouridine13 synthase